MRRGFKIASLFVLTGLSLAAAVVSSAAWFYGSADVSNAKINGSSEGAYFAYGDGSSEHPFGINHPRHMYNLSWLNMRGYFDGKTVYFELDPKLSGKVLDCEGYVIPPIGTVEHPFMGNFDGNGCTITNLTVTNSKTEIQSFKKYPYNAFTIVGTNPAFWPNPDPQIVGLFGVVGSYTDACTVASTTNEIVDLGIDGINVNTTTNQTLVGIAAGYLNGTLYNVAVNNCTLNIASNSKYIESYRNISNYSLVGFATAPYLKNLSKKNYTLDVPDISHNSGGEGGTDWNASINMKSMYQRLKNLYSGSTLQRLQYTSSEHRSVDIDGNTTVISSSSTNAPGPNSSNYDYYASYEQTYDNKVVASYTLGYDNGNFMYLYGDKDENRVVNNGLSVKTDYEFHGIHDGKGNYLVSSSATAVTNSTSFSSINNLNYGKWTLDSSGHLKNEGRNVYLYAYSDTAVRTSATAGNGTEYVWTYDSNNNRLSVVRGNTTLYLVYQNGWKLVTATDTYQVEKDSYYIRTTNTTPYYLNVTWNGTTPTLSASTTSNNTEWYKDGNYYYVLRSGSTDKYYLRYGSNVTVSTNTSNRFQLYSNSIFYYRSGNTTYYIYVNNGTISRNRNNYSSFNIAHLTENVPIYTDISIYRDGTASINSTENAYYNTKPTYYPLSFDDNGGVADNNTGYVISGTGSEWGDIRVSQYSTSDIRVSHNTSGNYNDTMDKQLQVISASAATGGDFYLIQDTHNADTTTLSDGLINNTVGVNTTRKTVKEFGFKKYNSARNGLQTMLNGGSNIYGLHFMNSLINSSNIIKVPYAKVNDKDRSTLGQDEDPFSIYDGVDYEMPRDSIDFNLSTKGTINFFAGTYYSNNDTFFSLHTIERYKEDVTENGVVTHKAHSIKSIKEISKIYRNYYSGSGSNTTDAYSSKNSPYIYLYSDGTYSDPDAANHMVVKNEDNVVTLGPTLVFDMAWVTNPKIIQNAVYYFEIPVNKGEYALGSVSSTTRGAYLMYLDIGAASVDIDSVLIKEKMTIDEDKYAVPKGVDFAVVGNTSSSQKIDGGGSATITIPNNTYGSITYSYSTSSTGSVLACAPPSGKSITGGGNITSTFINDGVIISAANTIGSNGVVSVTKLATVTDVVYKKTEYNYNSDTFTLFKHVYYSDDPGEEYDTGWEESENESYEQTDVYDYEPLDFDELIYEGTDPHSIFNYVLLTNSTDLTSMTPDALSMTYDYDYLTYTYSVSITNLTDENIVMYISYILNDATNNIQYKLRINGNEVAVGSLVNVPPTSNNNGGGQG